jgi:hypothetical protein
MSTMPWWATLLTSGAAAAVVTFAINFWLLRPRPDLRLIRIAPSVADTERLSRSNDGSANWHGQHWIPAAWLRLANHGDGAAHDVKLVGQRCRPRVWAGDGGVIPYEGEPAATDKPMWSDTVAALESGQSISVNIIVPADRSQPKPVVSVSWARLPGRRWSPRGKMQFDFSAVGKVEYGRPGQTELKD